MDIGLLRKIFPDRGKIPVHRPPTKTLTPFFFPSLFFSTKIKKNLFC